MSRNGSKTFVAETERVEVSFKEPMNHGLHVMPPDTAMDE